MSLLSRLELIRSTSLTILARGAVVLSFAIAPASCSDDDEPSAAEVCGGACRSAIEGCVQSETTEANCSAACQLGYAVVPACTDQYSSVLACSGGRPFLQCTSDTVTISTAVAECAEPLTTYLTCVAADLLPACLAVPLGDPECAAAGLPGRAYACVGETPAGCQLFEGTVREGGVGSFCCP